MRLLSQVLPEIFRLARTIPFIGLKIAVRGQKSGFRPTSECRSGRDRRFFEWIDRELYSNSPSLKFRLV